MKKSNPQTECRKTSKQICAPDNCQFKKGEKVNLELLVYPNLTGGDGAERPILNLVPENNPLCDVFFFKL